MPRSASPSRPRPARWLRGALLLAALGVAPAAVAGDIAVVVHPSVKVENLTFVELRKILRGDRQFWAPGKPVTLVVRAPDAPERTVLLKKVYEMNEAQFKQYWVAKVFRAEATDGPKVVISNQKVVELVGVIPGAISLVEAGDVPEGITVVKIDGKAPGEAGYALK
jgi:ABC-type phosphate transport system substrate-binding protein